MNSYRFWRVRGGVMVSLLRDLRYGPAEICRINGVVTLHKSKLLAVSLIALGVGACSNSDEAATSATDDADVTAANENVLEDLKSNAEQSAEREKLMAEKLAEANAFLADVATRDGIQSTDSGILYEVLENGPDSGSTPISTDRVVVHYVGTLKDGIEFDSSRARGAAAAFQLNRVIPGWTEGVQLMSEGDRYRFFLPPDLAYGESGAGDVIGPNEALIFDVELLKVHNPEKNLERARAYLENNKANDSVQTTESGLQYKILSEGPSGGVSPSAENTVRVHYRGTLTDGTEFDSSYQRGEPAEFPLSRVIPGWTEGVQLMSVGDKFQFFVPPELAYGERAPESIGPNQTLIFDVELLDVK